HNIVITRNRGWVANDVTIAASLDDAMSLCSDSPEICIIGGGEVFEQGLLIANELHITIVDVKVNNPTVFFPKIDYNNWKLINEESIVSSGGVSCHFKDYIRI
ncbi:MAG: dihydrofolate reductase, partial [Neisseriaceae bacterium]